jgi:hypothetical protein
MLQAFYIDVAKVDRDVAHVAMVIHVCFKCMFQMFYLFQMYVASILFRCCKSRPGCCIYMQVFQVFSYVCCKCFIWMFAMAIDVFSSFFWYFASVADVCCKCSLLQKLFLEAVKMG